jgi:hypothetical protein
MALKAILEKIDDAPEALREHYTEQDGKFVLSVEPVGGYALEDVSGLKSALGKERTTRENLEKEVVKYKDLDPDRARAALAELDELKKIDPSKEADKIANGKFEAAKVQLLEQHTKEVKAKDDRIATLTGAVDGLTRKQQATLALAEAKGSVELLLPHVLAHTRVKEADDGSFSVEVVDAAGNVRIADAQGTPMDVKGLVAEMRKSETFARAFDGDGHTGTDKKPDAPGAKIERGNFGGNRQERTAAIAAKFKLPA